MRTDAGSSTVETLAYTSVIVAAITVLVQATALAQAHLAVQAAATHAVQATRAYQGSTSTGIADARTVLAQIAPRLLTAVQVEAVRAGGTARVTISARTAPLAGGLQIPVTASATAPIEPEPPPGQP